MIKYIFICDKCNDSLQERSNYDLPMNWLAYEKKHYCHKCKHEVIQMNISYHQDCLDKLIEIRNDFDNLVLWNEENE